MSQAEEENVNEKTFECVKDNLTYFKKPGVVNEGIEYELYLLTLLKVRGENLTNSFYLASNMAEVGAFDDAVMKCSLKKDNSKDIIFFMQAKHKQSRHRHRINFQVLTSGTDFNLAKYFKSYLTIKRRIYTNSLHPLLHENVQNSDFYFIIYTNACFGDDISEERWIPADQNVKQFLLSKEDGKVYSFNMADDINDDIVKYVVNSHYKELGKVRKNIESIKKPNEALAEEFVNLMEKNQAKEIIDLNEKNKNLSKLIGNLFVLEKEKSTNLVQILKVCDSVDCKPFLNAVNKILESRGLDINIMEYRFTANSDCFPQLSLTSSSEIELQVTEFFNQLIMCVNQADVRQMHGVIKEDLYRFYKLLQKEEEQTFDQIIKKMKKWCFRVEETEFLVKEGKSFENYLMIHFDFEVKPPVQTFCGREEKIKKLFKSFQRNSKLAIVGLGGIGKTQLTRKFLKKTRSQYHGIIWINAECYSSLSESFRRLAREKLEISTKDVDDKEKHILTTVEEVYNFLSNRKCLFVFDNAEKLRSKVEGDEGISPFLQEGNRNHYILITSRNQQWGTARVVKLGELSKEACITLTKQILQIDDNKSDEDIKELVDTLQCYPLAIQQAGAYIGKTSREFKAINKMYHVKDYLKEYREMSSSLLDYEFPSDNNDPYTRTTMATVLKSYKKIKIEHGNQFVKILNIVSYLAPTSIPTKMFYHLFQPNDSQKLSKAIIVICEEYSMMQNSKKILDIHRIVQEVIRIEQKRENIEKEMLEDIFSLLKRNFEISEKNKYDANLRHKLLPHAEALLSHLEKYLKKDSSMDIGNITGLLKMMSEGYKRSGDYNKCIELSTRKYEIEREHYGEMNKYLLETMNLLSSYLITNGNMDKAKEYLEKALSIGESLLSDHIDVQEVVAVSLHNLGRLFKLQRNFEKAIDFLQKSLKMKEKLFGYEDYRLVRTINHLGNVYDDSGEKMKAKALYEKALSISKEFPENDIPKIAHLYYNLGLIYKSLDCVKAKELCEIGLDMMKTFYGSESFHLVNLMNGLGLVYDMLEEQDNAKKIYEEALKINEKHLGVNHINNAHLRHNLSLIYSDKQSFKKAKEELKKSLKIKVQFYGNKSFHIVETMNCLATVYKDLGQFNKSEAIYKEALSINQDHSVHGRQITCDILHNLSLLYYNDINNIKKAEKQLQKTLEAKISLYGRDDCHLVTTMNLLGLVCHKWRKVDEAKNLYNKALDINRRALCNDNLNLKTVRNWNSERARLLKNLGLLYLDSKELTKAKDEFQRSLEVIIVHCSEDYIRRAKIMREIARVNYKEKNFQEALNLYEEALKYIKTSSLHLDITSTLLYDIARSYEKLGNLEEAKNMFSRSLEVGRMIYGESSKKLVSS